jgi:hypothetical protein
MDAVADTDGVPAWLVKPARPTAPLPPSADTPNTAPNTAPNTVAEVPAAAAAAAAERRKMFTFAEQTLAAPAAARSGYRNKVVFTLGVDGGGGSVAGFRVADGLTAAAGDECMVLGVGQPWILLC